VVSQIVPAAFVLAAVPLAESLLDVKKKKVVDRS